MISFLKKLFKKPNELCGFNLDRWNFLGCTRIESVDKGTYVAYALILFFESKKDYKRNYKIIDPFKHDFENHPWCKKYLFEWMNNVVSHYVVITGPSDYLVGEAEKIGYTWDISNARWKKVPKYSNSNNVIEVNFKK